MVRFLVLSLITLLVACSYPEQPDVGVIPQPNSIVKEEGTFTITETT